MAYCKCGRIIVWGKTPSGQNIPLDPKAPVYRFIAGRPDGGPDDDMTVDRAMNCMVSHFATCPQANQFSASNKDRQDRKDVDG